MVGSVDVLTGGEYLFIFLPVSATGVAPSVLMDARNRRNQLSDAPEMPKADCSKNRSPDDVRGAHVDVVDILAKTFSREKQDITNYLLTQIDNYNPICDFFFYFGMTIISFMLSICSLASGDIHLMIFLMIFGIGLDVANLRFLPRNVLDKRYVFDSKKDPLRFGKLRVFLNFYVIVSFLLFYVFHIYIYIYKSINDIFPQFSNLCTAFFSNFSVYDEINTIIQTTYHQNGNPQFFDFFMISLTVIFVSEFCLIYTFHPSKFWAIVTNKKYPVIEASLFWSNNFMMFAILISTFLVSLYLYLLPYVIVSIRHSTATDYYLDPGPSINIGYVFSALGITSVPCYIQFLSTRVAIIKAAQTQLEN
jgi:hypothetical protein